MKASNRVENSVKKLRSYAAESLLKHRKWRRKNNQDLATWYHGRYCAFKGASTMVGITAKSIQFEEIMI